MQSLRLAAGHDRGIAEQPEMGAKEQEARENAGVGGFDRLLAGRAQSLGLQNKGVAQVRGCPPVIIVPAYGVASAFTRQAIACWLGVKV